MFLKTEGMTTSKRASTCCFNKSSPGGLGVKRKRKGQRNLHRGVSKEAQQTGRWGNIQGAKQKRKEEKDISLAINETGSLSLRQQ